LLLVTGGRRGREIEIWVLHGKDESVDPVSLLEEGRALYRKDESVDPASLVQSLGHLWHTAPVNSSGLVLYTGRCGVVWGGA
jgi:hypothetical protein